MAPLLSGSTPLSTTVHAPLLTPHKAAMLFPCISAPLPLPPNQPLGYLLPAEEAEVVQPPVDGEWGPCGQHSGLTALDTHPLYHTTSLKPSFGVCQGRGGCEKKWEQLLSARAEFKPRWLQGSQAHLWGPEAPV